MAITLQITDGTNTVDLNDGTNLSLGEAFQMNVGDGPVTEAIIAGWHHGIDADSKAIITKRFNQLVRKAILHYRDQRIDRAVWLVWKPDAQTDVQYAKVMGGGEVEIPTHTIGARGGGTFNPTLIREGAWRSVAPDGTAGASVHSSATVYNKSDADGNNWLDIASTRTNDAPSLLKITIDPNDSSSNFAIAMKRGATADLNNFNPHFNPADQSSGHSTSVEGAAPGNARIDLTSDNTVTWSIADTVLADYVGNYLVYGGLYQSSGAGSAQVRYTSDTVTGNYVDVESGVSSPFFHYLGSFNIPGTEINPFESLDSSSDFEIGLQVDITGTATVQVFGLTLIPTDIPPYFCNIPSGTTTDNLVINGVDEQSYIIDGTSGGIVVGDVVNARGRYQRTIGGTVNRIFFYRWKNNLEVNYEIAMSVNIEVTDRFLGLRGST